MARTVVVTGGGTGIGRAVAASFATQGDTVVITGRRPEPLKHAAAEFGPNTQAVVCDATDPAQVEAVRPQLPDSVDVLVNCAGGNTDLDRDRPGDLAALAGNWRANLEANLISAVLMTAAVTDRLAEGGAVISIGSIAADKGAGAYGAAKAGLASWNIELAAELGPRGDRERRRARLRGRYRILPGPAQRPAPGRADRRHQHRPREHTRGCDRRHRLLGLSRRPADHRAGARRQRRCPANPLNPLPSAVRQRSLRALHQRQMRRGSAVGSWAATDCTGTP